MDENTPANEDYALMSNVEALMTVIFYEDEPDEEQPSEVAAEADGLRRAIKGDFDAWLLISEAQLMDANSHIVPSIVVENA